MKYRQCRFIVYDERANPVDGTDDAQVYVIENTQTLAERWPEPGYIWRYDIMKHELVNETFIGPTRKLAEAQRQEDARRMK